MSKITDFTNKKILNSLPFTEKAARDMIKHLLTYKNLEVNFSHEDKYVLKQTLMFIENNSGLNVFDILEEGKK